METDIIRKAMESLDDLLEQERNALLRGDLKKLDTLVEAKEALLEELAQTKMIGESDLGPLQDKLKRNQRLLDHALEGIRSVTSRMAILRQIKSSLDTYDRSGQKKRIETRQQATVEKRA